MLPHARPEILTLAQHSDVQVLEAEKGWAIQQWHLNEEDVDRAVSAYRAILAVDLEAELTQLLVDMGVDQLGAPPVTVQHAKVARADAVELIAAATVVSVDGTTIDALHMPNVPKMAGMKSDSGIDIIGVELDETVKGEIVDGERLLIVSVKHTIGRYASGMRALLERSVGEDLSTPYLYRQLTTLHGRLVQGGTLPEAANRVFYFLRDTLRNPRVRIVCVGASAPPPECNLPDQPSLLTQTEMPDAHFRILLIPDLASLHEKLI